MPSATDACSGVALDRSVWSMTFDTLFSHPCADRVLDDAFPGTGRFDSAPVDSQLGLPIDLAPDAVPLHGPHVFVGFVDYAPMLAVFFREPTSVLFVPIEGVRLAVRFHDNGCAETL